MTEKEKEAIERKREEIIKENEKLGPVSSKIAEINKNKSSFFI